MTATDSAAVAHHVRRLDRGELRAFVVDLWDARGYETTVDGDVVRATSDARTVRIAVGAATDDPDVDVLVAPSRRPVEREDVRVLDGRDVAELLDYAVEPAAARRLCRTHFGAPPGALRPSPVTRLRRRASAAAERVPPAPVVAVVVIAIGLVGVAQFPIGAGSDDEPSNQTVGSSVATATPGEPTPISRLGPDWKSSPPGGYLQFICEAENESDASVRFSEDCLDSANATAAG